MKKLKKISALKKLAWKYFSEWTRRKWADSSGMVSCCSCQTRIHWKEANSSHWKHGHSKQSFLMESNVNPSCIRCNLYLSGNLSEYTLWMLEKFGNETIEKIRAASHKIWKPSRQELEDLILEYKKKIEGLNG